MYYVISILFFKRWVYSCIHKTDEKDKMLIVVIFGQWNKVIVIFLFWLFCNFKIFYIVCGFHIIKFKRISVIF